MKDSSISANTAICLSSPDVEALLQGRSIFALSRNFISSATRRFAVLAVDETLGNFSLKDIYKPNFILDATQAKENFSRQLMLPLIAEAESSQLIIDSESFENLAENSVWTRKFLETILSERGRLFLNFLRVYKVEPLLGFQEKVSSGKLSCFIKLQKSITAKSQDSILTDSQFSQRKKQFQESKPSLYPDLEALQSTIVHYAKTYPAAKILDHDLRTFLGWTNTQPITDTDQTQNWIQTIASSGNSSDGSLFEKRVRQSFLHLGFTNSLNNIKAALDPDAIGGAGGIDIYCEKPFPIVGECKASKYDSVSNGVCAQLINLGTTHLGKDQFEASIKIIFATGKLTPGHAEPAAIQHQMNVMRPETLQRLVELKAAHPGAIDLLELKPCLENAPFGTDADTKVNEFIDLIWQRIELRSHVIQAVKELKEDGDELVSASTVRTHFNAGFPIKRQERLDTPEQAYAILIELSSPLTGYLGRTKGNTWKDDRFYFLRDLIVAQPPV